MVIFTLCFTETKATSPNSFSDRISKAQELSSNITVDGIFNSIPLIIFSYMYQPLIPAIYHELKEKTLPNMNSVLIIGTTIASVIYILVGMFGYITFTMNADFDKIMEE
jgi:amino acid permease